jgi:hypothetical protein
VDDDYDLLLPYPNTFFHFARSQKYMRDITPDTPWQKKISKAIWRGRTTGGLFTNWTKFQFPRTRLVQVCQAHPDLCDAKFVGFPQCFDGVSDSFHLLNMTDSELSLAALLRYKYNVVPDGNAAPSSRLAAHLGLSSVIFKQESPTHEWYYNDLKPYVHYIPISYYFSDLPQKVKWAQRHDVQVQRIVRNANMYVKSRFSERAVACYLHDLVTSYTKLLLFNTSVWGGLPKEQLRAIELPQDLIERPGCLYGS